MEIEFQEFRKIPRLSREIIVTEKIDGTNAQIYIDSDGEMKVGSRNRWISPGKTTDNAGFAAWAEEHKDELRFLGPGRHYGEWYGKGIQRGYGLDNKRFALFNTSQFEMAYLRPACCECVPILYRGPFNSAAIDMTLKNLAINGSYAVPGWMKPEGVVVYHIASGYYFKKTIENDEVAKSQLETK